MQEVSILTRQMCYFENLFANINFKKPVLFIFFYFNVPSILLAAALSFEFLKHEQTLLHQYLLLYIQGRNQINFRHFCFCFSPY